MAPATIQLIIGVMEVFLRVMSLIMACAAIFVFYLHSFALRTAREARVQEEKSVALGEAIARPAPFILRSTRPTESTVRPAPDRLASKRSSRAA